MQNVSLILLVFAFVFACIAALFSESIRNVHVGWLAVAFWIIAEILGGVGRLLH